MPPPQKGRRTDRRGAAGAVERGEKEDEACIPSQGDPLHGGGEEQEAGACARPLTTSVSSISAGLVSGLRGGAKMEATGPPGRTSIRASVAAAGGSEAKLASSQTCVQHRRAFVSPPHHPSDPTAPGAA